VLSAQVGMEVSGLDGRAAEANGVYELARARPLRQNGRPVWVQIDATSRRGPARLCYDDTGGESPAWIVEVPSDRGKAYAYVEEPASSPDAVVRQWNVWQCDTTAPIEAGRWSVAHTGSRFRIRSTRTSPPRQRPSSRSQETSQMFSYGVQNNSTLHTIPIVHTHRRGPSAHTSGVSRWQPDLSQLPVW
jgi:hypothetical protein